MPFATAFRTDSAPAPSPTPGASRLPCPWRPRESETSSRSRILAAPSAHRLLAAPSRSFRPASSQRRLRIWLGSRATLTTHWKPPAAAACLHPRSSLARGSPPTPKCQRTGNDTGPSSEEPAPNRNDHGCATRSAPHSCSSQRSGSSTLPPTVTRCDRWVETTFEEAYRPCSARRREASCRDVRPDTVQGALRAAPPENGNVWRSSTDHRLNHRSGARAQLTLSSCSKVLPPPRSSRSESLANSPLARDYEQLRRPEGHPRQRNPARSVDARRPPRGDPPTPELPRSSEMQTPG